MNPPPKMLLPLSFFSPQTHSAPWLGFLLALSAKAALDLQHLSPLYPADLYQSHLSREETLSQSREKHRQFIRFLVGTEVCETTTTTTENHKTLQLPPQAFRLGARREGSLAGSGLMAFGWRH